MHDHHDQDRVMVGDGCTGLSHYGYILSVRKTEEAKKIEAKGEYRWTLKESAQIWHVTFSLD